MRRKWKKKSRKLSVSAFLIKEYLKKLLEAKIFLKLLCKGFDTQKQQKCCRLIELFKKSILRKVIQDFCQRLQISSTQKQRFCLHLLHFLEQAQIKFFIEIGELCKWVGQTSNRLWIVGRVTTIFLLETLCVCLILYHVNSHLKMWCYSSKNCITRVWNIWCIYRLLLMGTDSWLSLSYFLFRTITQKTESHL